MLSNLLMPSTATKVKGNENLHYSVLKEAKYVVKGVKSLGFIWEKQTGRYQLYCHLLFGNMSFFVPLIINL